MTDLRTLQDKHRRARIELGLDPTKTSSDAPFPAGSRVRGRVGLTQGSLGTVKRESWKILPVGQMIVRFDAPVVDRSQWIAVTPDEVDRIS